MFDFFKRQWFFYAYAALIVPSYVLPWIGSNSMMAAIFSESARSGFGFHALTLLGAVGLSFFRGWQIKKPHLGLIALTALACDFLPLINLIPFLPSLFHGITLLLGTNIRVDINPKRLDF